LVIPKSGHNGGKKGIGRILLFGIQELRKEKKKWKEKWRERKKERKKEIKEENKSKKSF
jgi:hypothetical protein